MATTAPRPARPVRPRAYVGGRGFHQSARGAQGTTLHVGARDPRRGVRVAAARNRLSVASPAPLVRRAVMGGAGLSPVRAWDARRGSARRGPLSPSRRSRDYHTETTRGRSRSPRASGGHETAALSAGRARSAGHGSARRYPPSPSRCSRGRHADLAHAEGRPRFPRRRSRSLDRRSERASRSGSCDMAMARRSNGAASLVPALWERVLLWEYSHSAGTKCSNFLPR